MKTQFRETMKIHTALSKPEENGPFIWCRFEFDPEFRGNSYEFQHTFVSEIYGAMGELLKELEVKAHWEEKMELAETDEDLRDVAREMLKKIDEGFFDDDGGEARQKRRKMN